MAIDLVPAPVEDKVQVETPMEFVKLQAPSALPLPEAVKVGVTPLTALV